VGDCEGVQSGECSMAESPRCMERSVEKVRRFLTWGKGWGLDNDSTGIIMTRTGIYVRSERNIIYVSRGANKETNYLHFLLKNYPYAKLLLLRELYCYAN